jgi:hypothetical protein
MGLPLPNPVQTWIQPRMDQMGLNPILASLFLGQGQWRIWERVQVVHVSKARLPVGPIPIHLSDGHLAPYLSILATDILDHILDDTK